MRYYSEVDEDNNLYKQRVCEAVDMWEPSKPGLRLVVDEEPAFNPLYQRVIRETGVVPGDAVPYSVVEFRTLDDATRLLADAEAAAAFLHSKGISFYPPIYLMSAFSVDRGADIYNLFTADTGRVVKVHAGAVIEHTEDTTEFGGVSALSYLLLLGLYPNVRGDAIEQASAGGSSVTRHFNSEPPRRGSLDPTRPIIFWSLKASGDIIIEYTK